MQLNVLFLTLRNVKWSERRAGGQTASLFPTILHCLSYGPLENLWSRRASISWACTQCFFPFSVSLVGILFGAGIWAGGASRAFRPIGGGRWSGPAQTPWCLVFGTRRGARLRAAVLFWRVRWERLHTAHGSATWTAAERVTWWREGVKLTTLTDGQNACFWGHSLSASARHRVGGYRPLDLRDPEDRQMALLRRALARDWEWEWGWGCGSGTLGSGAWWNI